LAASDTAGGEDKSSSSLARGAVVGGADRAMLEGGRANYGRGRCVEDRLGDGERCEGEGSDNNRKQNKKVMLAGQRQSRPLVTVEGERE